MYIEYLEVVVHDDGVMMSGDDQIIISARTKSLFLMNASRALERENNNLKDNNYNQFYGK